MPSIIERLQHAWNAFNNKDPTNRSAIYYGGTTYRPDRIRYTRGNDKSMFAPILNRMATDAANIDIKHVRLDDQGRFKEEIDSGLNEALNVEANIDQTGRAFRQDVYASLLDEGSIAIVPTEGDVNWSTGIVTKVETLRVAKIIEWFPRHIKVEVYNDMTGKKEQLRYPKSMCAILENPFYPIMNEPNSTLQRLKRKLLLLDQLDEKSASGKLDVIIQLPYSTRSEARKQQAENRRHELEVQLSNSKYGVAYTDASEHIIQLNRSLENNLIPQIKDLTEQLYTQIGVPKEILDGSATEQQQLNYLNNIIEPLVSTVVNEIKRKFLTRTARTQRQSILFFRDPFKLVPVSNVADIADKFTRNEILSSNEVRGIIGFKPSTQEGADELRNKNLNQSKEALQKPLSEIRGTGESREDKNNSEEIQNGT